MSQPRLPDNSHRLSIIGRTGTGKTFTGLWHLSLKNFFTFPWVIFDAKGDQLINEISAIPGVEQIGFADNPKGAGLYHMRATPPAMKSDLMERFLWRIHQRGRCGLFLDEGYVFDRNSDALNTIYTQGRSLKIPVITLSQRPAWLSAFSFSEADFIQAFDLNRKEDQKRVEEFAPFTMRERLRDYHSRWYDVGRNDVREFSPVPPQNIILDNFEAHVRRRKRVI